MIFLVRANPQSNSLFSNMVFRRTMLVFLLQCLVIISKHALSVHQHHHPLHHSLETDRAALLEFKSTITSDPNSRLSNWNDSTHVCYFTGVRCNKERHRVWQLNLNDSDIVGTLSLSITNLTHLRVLELRNNQLSGKIPREFSSLRHLRHLLLGGNNLHGQIPDTFSLLVKLTAVDLRLNRLTGKVPPYFFSNSTFLKNVDLSFNFLEGNIPEIGSCRGLWNLNLYNNQLTGEIPFSITNASGMVNLDVEYNLLSGELPLKIVKNLPDLRFLHLSFNALISPENNSNLDPFFTALCNYTSVEEVELEGMGLGGKLPTSIGKCVYLESLLLQENNITGSILPTLSNLTHLWQLNLTSNLLNGTIPEEISQLPLLEQLSLSRNSLSGPIPAALGQFQLLGLLDLSSNKFSGEIPKSLGNLTQINYMLLNNNLLSGSIPSSLGQCRDLYKLDLSYNNLTGNIPLEISGLREIRIFVNLSHNFLEGDLPIELSKLEYVREMDLSSNRFTGRVFPRISSCIALSSLNISHNLLEGELPESLGDLKNLEVFDVSGNQLSGRIPKSLSNIHTLTFLNLSINRLSGTVPSGGIFDSLTNLSFLLNGKLCGQIPGIPKCHKNTKKLFHSTIFLIVFGIVISLSVVLLVVWYLKMVTFAGKDEPETEPEPEWIHNFPRISYKELLDATGGFDEERKLGSGSSGSVYRGVLPNGTCIAVKVLQLQTGSPPKSFNRECQVLRSIRHRNLIRIITTCSQPDFKALVLPYMANGSLDSQLYPHSGNDLCTSGSSGLTLIQRVNICSDIAEGMAYLHHHSPIRVIHRDLNPSNVLLNDNMTALVSDFGIARLVVTVEWGNNCRFFENVEKSSGNMLCGSIGYIAPEYGLGSDANIKGDVYSFGIIVLEMVTRKRPTDNMFTGGLSLPRWVKNHFNGRIERVVDSLLVKAMRDQSPEEKKMWEVAIEELTELGILCTLDSPSTRPTMLDAADDLARLKHRLKRYPMEHATARFASTSNSTLQ